MEYIICLFVLLTVIFVMMGFLRFGSTKDIYRERLLMATGQKNAGSDGQRITLVKSGKTIVRAVSHLFAARSFTADLQAKLVTAGIPLKGEEYITISLGIVIFAPILTYLGSQNFWLAVIVLILALILPWMYINIKRDRRLATFEQQLADALMIMANALRAGFGFQQAMETVVKETSDPIATEFEWTLREMGLGFSQEEALLNLGRRVNSREMDMVISGIIIQRQVGGNLAQILDNLVVTMRDRNRIKKQVRVLTAQGKMSGLIVGLLPVVLLAAMLVINPEQVYFLFQDHRGWVMLGTGTIMELMGLMIIRRITDIDF